MPELLTHTWGVYVRLHSVLTHALGMDANGELHAPTALCPGKEALLPSGEEAGQSSGTGRLGCLDSKLLQFFFEFESGSAP